MSNIFDARWGAETKWQTIVWPILLPFKTERISEIAVYSGRIPFGIVGAMICLLFKGFNKQLRTLCFVMLFGSLLWSVSSGYVRYALYLELISGLLLLCTTLALCRSDAFTRLPLQRSSKFLILAVLIVQSALACAYIYRYEWGG